MPISRRVLADDEEVLVDIHLHWVYFLGPAVLTAVAVAVAIAVAVRVPNAPTFVAWILGLMVAVPALWLGGRVFKWMGISLVVTTTRVIYRQGLLGRDIVQLRMQRVTEVHCTQTLLERLIGSGRMVIEVEGDGPMAIDDVRRPAVLQRVITRQLDAFQSALSPSTGIAHQPGPVSRIGDQRRGGGDGQSWDVTPPRGTPRFDSGSRVSETDPLPSVEPTGRESHGRPGNRADNTAPPIPVTMASISEQLVALEGLRRRGIVSDEEFAAKKAELLDRI
ncbi:MAG: SHOCT domain-containing protein [Acidimicrobiales bacterium]